MTIGERIKQRRIELGLTQTELAHRMGLTSKTTICKAETTDFNPTTDRVREFAKALECTPAYLMGWEEQHEVEYKVDGISIEKDEATKRAEYLYDLYKSAPPEVQVAVEAILKSAKQDSGSHNQLP